jgi:hypothetical protein
MDSSSSLSCFLFHDVLAGESVFRVVYNESHPEESSANSFLSGVSSILERVSVDIEELRMLPILLAPANQKFASYFVFVPLTDALIIKYVNIFEFC